MAKLIMRNSSVPAQATEMFSTSEDGQVNIALRVLQGEREMAQDCRLLADFELSGLPPMPAGIPQVEVEFLVDADGILSVRAVERRSGKRASVQVAARHGLSRAEVDRMEEESLTFAKSDMHLHRVADLVVQAGLDAKWTREAMGRVPYLEPNYQEELEHIRHSACRTDFLNRVKSNELLKKEAKKAGKEAPECKRHAKQPLGAHLVKTNGKEPEFLAPINYEFVA